MVSIISITIHAKILAAVLATTTANGSNISAVEPTASDVKAIKLTASTVQVIALWDECGWPSLDHKTICAEGYCKKMEEGNSLCVPEEDDFILGASDGHVPLYGQCGGYKYSGPTTCSAGICQVKSQWLSQCIPKNDNKSSEGSSDEVDSMLSPDSNSQSSEYYQKNPKKDPRGNLGQQVLLWGKCGGVDHDGSTLCKEGTCQKINDWFSQCVPLDSEQKSVPLWAQCGGLDYTGATVCDEGVCVIIAEMFSQCVPVDLDRNKEDLEDSSLLNSGSGSNLHADVPLWAQCGGQSYNGRTDCIEGICSERHPSYSQCVPYSNLDAIPLWGQCGGLNYAGNSVCKEGICKRSDLWYSQCVPNIHPETLVPLWGQCGGKSHIGGTLCEGGGICIHKTTEYSQCEPGRASPLQRS